jgi:signal transduction histidine kinase
MAGFRYASLAAVGDYALRPMRDAARLASGHVGVAAAICAGLVCGSILAGGTIQLRNDRAHALAQAASFDAQRSREIALDLGSAFNRYEALGSAFANASTNAETSAALAAAGGQALKNVAVLEDDGTLDSELTTDPQNFLPLPAATLAAARTGRAIAPGRDGRSFALVYRAGPHIVAVELDSRALMPWARDEDALAVTLSGQVLAAGAAWRALPDMGALALHGHMRAQRLVDVADGRRLIALHRVAGWPLAAGASSRVKDALDAWYGALPLYLLMILGPSLAGAALAVVFVRDFERRARAAESRRRLQAIEPDEARLRVRLADAERRAASAERVQRDFMGHMSHELRTPLNAIIGFSEVIEKGVFGPHPKYTEYGRDIALAGRELLGRIADILDFADLEEDKGTITPPLIDVAPIVRLLADEHIMKAHARGHQITTALPPSAFARADAGDTRRIVASLIANALAYSASGSAVRIEMTKAEGALVITVRDRGFGFSPEELEKVGEPFRRFDRTGATTGTGLGLAIAVRLARRMGASLRLLSRQGDGTIAELWLPEG